MTTPDAPEPAQLPEPEPPIFLDTNVLVYAAWQAAPLHSFTLTAIETLEERGTPLLISRQVLRELLATLTRPQFGVELDELLATVRDFEVRFQVIEDSPAIFAQLLTLLERGTHGRRLFDTNLVATMQVAGVPALLTNNPDDFAAFRDLITIIPLVQ